MRNRWDAKGEDKSDKGDPYESRTPSRYDEPVDEPVTLTERQLRSLKRGARAGLFALFLAIVAAGLAGWTSFREIKQDSNQATSAESGLAQASIPTPDPSATTAAPTPAPSASPVQPAAPAATATKIAPAATATKIEAGSATKSSKALPPPPKRKSSTARAQKPVTEAFDPTPAAAASTPSPTPVPISIEPSKPAAQDSSR